MNKADLIETLSEALDISKQTGKEALEALLGAISEALIGGNEVVLPGFGTFEVKERAARMGRNPQTGEPLSIPKSWSINFKPSTGIKKQVIDAHRAKES